jgi:predicted amidophosphoribosyltransferase
MLGVLDGGRRFDAFMPVPLHRSRLRKRGFN